MRPLYIRTLPFYFAALTFLIYFYVILPGYLSFPSLKAHRELLNHWLVNNYNETVFLFMVLYILFVASSLPGATFLTIIAGFLFGLIWGTVYVLMSATIGAVLLFLLIRLVLTPWVRKSMNNWINKMRTGFQSGAIRYLLILRLVPLFPFWIVNIVAALLDVRMDIFIVTTFIGIIPGTLIYVWLGTGLGALLDQDKAPDLSIIFSPSILIPLILLALLTFLPSLYHYLFKRKGK